jgi:hypothetical protein
MFARLYYNNASFAYNGKIIYVGIWNVALSAAAAQELHADPYAFLVPPAPYLRYSLDSIPTGRIWQLAGFGGGLSGKRGGLVA